MVAGFKIKVLFGSPSFRVCVCASTRNGLETKVRGNPEHRVQGLYRFGLENLSFYVPFNVKTCSSNTMNGGVRA